MSDENQEQPDQALLTEAKNMGWVDKESFRGNPEHWVPAKDFVEKGRHVLPIVTAHNTQLRGEVTTMKGQIGTLADSLRAANATIEALQESNAADVAEQVKEARENLEKELEAASREGDHAGVAQITSKLTQLASAGEDSDADKEKKKRDKELQQQRQSPQIAPEIVQWYQDNPDFSNNRRAVNLAHGIAAELREAGEPATGKTFMDKVKAETFKALGLSEGGRTGKTETGNGGHQRNQQNGGGGKTYADLPPEAKAACDKQATRLVGQNRAHKDVNSWRASYVKQYFQE